MSGYLLVRGVAAIILLMVIMSGTFILTRSIGDPVRLLLPPDASSEQIASFRAQLGLNRPLWEQLGDFLSHAMRGDFGESIWQRRGTLEIVAGRLLPTLMLAASALLTAVFIGVPLGTAAAAMRNSWIDKAITLLSLSFISIPYFWLGLLLILLFPVTLGILRTGGYGSWEHFVLPTIIGAALPAGRIAQVTRSTLLDVLTQDYIRTARAKGLTEQAILFRHALPNAALPIITMAGWDLARLLGGGLVIVETIFSWPGLGRLTFQAIERHDFPLIQTAIFVQASMVIALNFIIDAAYTLIDPRVRIR